MYMHFILFVAPPESIATHNYYNYTIELNQPVLLNCSFSAVPYPEFQWILQNHMDHLSEFNWNSTCTNMTCITTSTLNYTFGMADLNESCMINVVCTANNSYGKSKQKFTLLLKSSENYCSQNTTKKRKDGLLALLCVILVVCITIVIVDVLRIIIAVGCIHYKVSVFIIIWSRSIVLYGLSEFIIMKLLFNNNYCHWPHLGAGHCAPKFPKYSIPQITIILEVSNYITMVTKSWICI